MTEDYEKWLPENPFVVANDFKGLYQKMNELIEDAELRNEVGEKGKIWVSKYHGYKQVNNSLKELYKLKNII
jgi:spore maturation protein CgeB